MFYNLEAMFSHRTAQLMPSMLGKHSRWHFKIFFLNLFSQQLCLDVSCKLSLEEKIFHEMSIYFMRKNMKNNTNLFIVYCVVV